MKVEDKTRSIEPVDREVGARVRSRRKLLGMSQSSLGDSIGVTFQQVQKYERGTNRIGSSRLQQIAVALGAPVASLFADDIQGAGVSDSGQESGSSYPKEVIELNKAFARIKDPAKRDAVSRLIITLSRS